MVYDGIIQGKTVRLRSIEERDAEVTYNMRRDPEKTRYIHRSQGTVEDQRDYIRRQRQLPDDYLFIIEDLEGTPIGMKGLYNYDKQNKQVESGRFLGFGSQIQNIEALMLSFDFSFEELNVDRIKMAALENNVTMLGIQKKFGAEYQYREKCDGFDQDNLFSVLTKEVYTANRKTIETLINRFAGR